MPVDRDLEGAFLWLLSGASKESDSTARDGGRSPTGTNARVRAALKDEIKMDSGFRRNDERVAFAGMTRVEAFAERKKKRPAFLPAAPNHPAKNQNV